MLTRSQLQVYPVYYLLRPDNPLAGSASLSSMVAAGAEILGSIVEEVESVSMAWTCPEGIVSLIDIENVNRY